MASSIYSSSLAGLSAMKYSAKPHGEAAQGGEGLGALFKGVHFPLLIDGRRPARLDAESSGDNR